MLPNVNRFFEEGEPYSMAARPTRRKWLTLDRGHLMSLMMVLVVDNVVDPRDLDRVSGPKGFSAFSLHGAHVLNSR